MNEGAESSANKKNSDTPFLRPDYRALLETIDAVTWELDVKSNKWTFISPQAERILGWEIDPNEGLNFWFAKLHPDEKEEMIQRTTVAIRGGGHHVTPFRFRQKDGTWKWYQNVVSVNFEGDSPSRVVGFTISINEQKVAEEALARSEDKYRSFFELSHMVNLMIDPSDGRIVEANPAAAAFYGWSVEKLKSMFISEINILSQDVLSKEMKKVISETKKQFIFKHRLADGSIRDVEVFSGRFDYLGKPMLYSFISDITERKKAEDKLKKLVGEKETLMRELQHRVKNNLNVVTSLLALERNNLENDRAKQVFTSSIDRIRTIALIYERLYLSADLVYVDLVPYITNLVSAIFEFSFSGEKKIGYELNLQQTQVDSSVGVPIGLIINELVTNAFKYAFKDRDAGNLKISLVNHGQELEIHVADDGCGIDEGFRLDKADSMGMILIRSLVQQLGAQVEFTRKEGTEIGLRIPFKK